MEAAEGVEKDLAILVNAMRRLADEKKSVKFGQLFRDEELEQQLESLVGSLKAAKKRNLLNFPGQMLLSPAHDDVDIVLS